jgi:3D (Asp-Asp-Asp) domain-containing protein
MGLLLLPNATTTVANAQPWTKGSPEAPTYNFQEYSVSMTGYNAVAAQTDNTPGITASGLPVNPEIDAARSRDLAESLPFGTVIELVPGTATSTDWCGLPVVEDSIGYRVITDTMNARHTNFIDILFDTDDTVTVGKRERNKAHAIGYCKDVQIRVVGHVDIKDVPATQKALKAVVAKQLADAANSDLAVAK